MKTCEICGGVVFSGNTTAVCSTCTNNIRKSKTTSTDSLADHICGCINADRRNCPLCKKPGHHDTTLSPKILISPM